MWQARAANKNSKLRWSTGPKPPPSIFQFLSLRDLTIPRKNMLLSAREWSIHLWLLIFSSILWWSNSVLLPKESNLLWTTSLPKLISDLSFLYIHTLYSRGWLHPCLSFFCLLCILLDCHQSCKYLLIPQRKDENKFIHSLNGLVQCPLFYPLSYQWGQCMFVSSWVGRTGLDVDTFTRTMKIPASLMPSRGWVYVGSTVADLFGFQVFGS